MAGHQRQGADIRGEQSEARRDAEVIDEHGGRLEAFDKSNGVAGDRLGLPQQVMSARIRLMQQGCDHARFCGREKRA